MQRLFVYGTLAPGRVNHHILAGIPGTWEEARLRGVLIEKGWGAAMGCPGILPDEDAGEVSGHVFTSLHLETHWERIDTFEGDGYERMLVSIEIESGQWAEAYVYALKLAESQRPG